jgi:hypothetical protein
VLATFDAPTRGAFRAVLVDLAKALDGRPGDVSATLGNAAPATEELRRLLELLERRDAEVGGVVRDSGTVLRSLAARRDALQRLVVAGDEVLGATAARDTELEATVRALPPFLRDARRTLATAEATALDAAPTLRALRPSPPCCSRRCATRRPCCPTSRRCRGASARWPRRRGAGCPRSPRSWTPPARRPARCCPPRGSSSRCCRPRTPTSSTRSPRWPRPPPPPSTAAGNLHVLRALLLITNESFYGQEQRAPSSRANAYVKPGGLQRLVEGGPLRTLSCQNTRNPEVVPPILSPGGPALRRAGPVDLRGKTATVPGARARRALTSEPGGRVDRGAAQGAARSAGAARWRSPWSRRSRCARPRPGSGPTGTSTRCRWA